jgi:NIPSNAP
MTTEKRRLARRPAVRLYSAQKEGFMKYPKSLVLFLGIIIILGVLPAAVRSQPVQPELYLVGDFLVDTSRVAEYEAAVKDLLANLAKHEFAFGLDIYSTDDGHYYAVYPLKNYADVDAWFNAWAELAQKMGPENLQALHRRIVAGEIERVYQFWYYRPDISFLPEKERLKPEEIGYYTWDFVWLIPGKEAEFESINKEWMALSKAKGARDPFFTWAGDMGTQMPVYVWVEYGRSAADYAATEEKFWKAMGEEGAALSKKTRALIKKMDSKTGQYRPDLSYAPKSK